MGFVAGSFNSAVNSAVKTSIMSLYVGHILNFFLKHYSDTVSFFSLIEVSKMSAGDSYDVDTLIHDDSYDDPPESKLAQRSSSPPPSNPTTNNNNSTSKDNPALLPDDEKRSLYLCLFRREVIERDIRDYMSRFGRISDMRIQPDRKIPGAIGCAFVTYETHQEAVKALDSMTNTRCELSREYALKITW